MSLDIDHGMYPHTTSSSTVAGQMSAGTGVGLNGDRQIIGVAKAYVSRVGISPFPTELHDERAEELREKGQEYGTTTGRPRRIGCLDLVQLRQAVRVNGLTDIALTKLDVLAGFSSIAVCTSYKIDGEIIKEMPASLDKMRRAKPTYTELDGWEEMSKDRVKYFCENGGSSLPAGMRKYIKFIEEEIECRISILSLGPDRNETILR
jgi:adenylosuccinate synthase